MNPYRLLTAYLGALLGITNLIMGLLFGTPLWIFSAINAVASAIIAWEIFHIIKETRHGKHRRTKAHTPNSEADYTGLVSLAAAHKALAAAHPAGFPAAGSYTYTTHTNAGPIKAAPPQGGPERVESDMPILAHRSARLYLDGTPQYFGAATMESVRFGVDADAVCAPSRYGSGHRAPNLECHCGFYALPTDIAPTYEAADYVTLMVELSGTVVEHERGYRAEHQRIIECQVEPCVYCGAEADLLVVRSFKVEQMTCSAHKPVDEPGVVYLSVADLTARLPVPVTRAGRREGSGR